MLEAALSAPSAALAGVQARPAVDRGDSYSRSKRALTVDKQDAICRTRWSAKSNLPPSGSTSASNRDNGASHHPGSESVSDRI